MKNDIFSVISIDKPPYFLKFYNLEKGYAYYKNYRINLQTNQKENYSIEKFLNHLNSLNFKKEFERPYVFHLFYELGYFFNNNPSLIKENVILAIELNYQKAIPYILKQSKNNSIIKEQKKISFSNYQKKFLQIKKHLLYGNCYQLNLTFPFEFSLKQKVDFDDLIMGIWENKEDRGAYAHASVIPPLKKIFISNSPECLFQIKKGMSKITLWTMPIKGSAKIENKNGIKKAWEELKNCPKNQAELFMITDLLKNDLSKIEGLGSKVIFKKKPLLVPKILHQYSLISTQLSMNVNLGKIVFNLFPGGSVTGAPKKRSMEILFKVESEIPRGFYCGSTIILYKSILAGSINIRSATLDLKNEKFHYGSGGGITLLSTAKEEFGEMNLKFESFLNKLLN